jgi:hypothetical protein
MMWCLSLEALVLLHDLAQHLDEAGNIGRDLPVEFRVLASGKSEGNEIRFFMGVDSYV